MKPKVSRRAIWPLFASAALGRSAFGQELPPEPKPQAPPTVTTPPPRPVAPASAIDKTKAYYLFFDQTIDVASMRNLRKQLTTLVEADVAEITLVIDSNGGQVDPMLETYSFILALTAKINTHAQGFVQSAATTLFLAGQERSADHTARFMFHPPQRAIAGTLAEQQMRENLMGFTTLGDVMLQIYHDRTRIPDADIRRFNQETVYYSAAQAQSVGVIQTVSDLHIPGADKAKIMFLE
jgi:ATP-dependent Clp protease protease subunit